MTPAKVDETRQDFVLPFVVGEGRSGGVGGLRRYGGTWGKGKKGGGGGGGGLACPRSLIVGYFFHAVPERKPSGCDQVSHRSHAM